MVMKKDKDIQLYVLEKNDKVIAITEYRRTMKFFIKQLKALKSFKKDDKFNLRKIRSDKKFNDYLTKYQDKYLEHIKNIILPQDKFLVLREFIQEDEYQYGKMKKSLKSIIKSDRMSIEVKKNAKSLLKSLKRERRDSEDMSGYLSMTFIQED